MQKTVHIIGAGISGLAAAVRLANAGHPPARLVDYVASVKKFSLQREDFLAIIDGMEMDVPQEIRAPDMATLDLYCDRVASAVGRLSVRVFGLPQDDGILLAHHLGRALQLTNILRDIDEDASLGRLYLPREYLEEMDCCRQMDPAAIVAKLHPKAATEIANMGANTTGATAASAEKPAVSQKQFADKPEQNKPSAIH